METDYLWIPTTSFADWPSVTTTAQLVNQTTIYTNETVAIEMPHSIPLTVIFALLAAIVALVTVVGNALVLLSFFLERTIRVSSNYFIASLALCDFLIGLISMPLYTVYLLLGRWPFSPLVCDLWLSLDYTVSLTSQYTVFFITVDRFCSVKIPTTYRNWKSKRKLLAMVAVTWLLPISVFFVTIIGWQYFVGVRTVPQHLCFAQFLENPLFNLILVICYYWVTLFVMIGLYVVIYRVALDLQAKTNDRRQRLNQALKHTMPEAAANLSSVGQVNFHAAQLTVDHSFQQQTSSTPSSQRRRRDHPDTPTDPESDNSSDENNPARAARLAAKAAAKADLRARRKSQAPSQKARWGVVRVLFKSKAGLQPTAVAERPSSPVRPHPAPLTQSTNHNADFGGIYFGPVIDPMLERIKTRASFSAATPTGQLTNQKVSRSTPVSNSSNQICLPGAGGGQWASRSVSNELASDDRATVSYEGDNSQRSLERSGRNSVLSSSENSNLGWPDRPLQRQNSAEPRAAVSVLKMVNSVSLEAARCMEPRLSQHNTELLLCAPPERLIGLRFIDQESLRSSLMSIDSSCIQMFSDLKAYRNRRQSSLVEWEQMNLCRQGSLSNSVSITMATLPTTDIISSHNIIESATSAIDHVRILDTSTGDAALAGDGGGEVTSGDSKSPIWKRRRSKFIHPLKEQWSVDSNPSGFAVIVEEQACASSAALSPDQQAASPPKARNSLIRFVTPRDSTAPRASSLIPKRPLVAMQPLGEVRTPSPRRSPQTRAHCLPSLHDHSAHQFADRVCRFKERLSSRFLSLRATCRRPLKGRFRSLRLHGRKSDPGNVGAARAAPGRGAGTKLSRKDNRAQKALRTITLILGAFVICWTPYHVFVVALGFCDGQCISPLLYAISYWMCYMNSPINPFCYAFAHSQFKKTFLRILKCDWHRT